MAISRLETMNESRRQPARFRPRLIDRIWCASGKHFQFPGYSPGAEIKSTPHAHWNRSQVLSPGRYPGLEEAGGGVLARRTTLGPVRFGVVNPSAAIAWWHHEMGFGAIMLLRLVPSCRRWAPSSPWCALLAPPGPAIRGGRDPRAGPSAAIQFPLPDARRACCDAHAIIRSPYLEVDHCGDKWNRTLEDRPPEMIGVAWAVAAWLHLEYRSIPWPQFLDLIGGDEIG
jgi:hypothetical protein